MYFRNVNPLGTAIILAVFSVGSVVGSSGCATVCNPNVWSDSTKGVVGGSVVLVGGGLTTWAVAESTAYVPDARDDAGRLIPVARQPEKNLIPVAIGLGALTVVIAGSIYAIAIADAVDLGEEAAPIGDAPPPPQ